MLPAGWLTDRERRRAAFRRNRTRKAGHPRSVGGLPMGNPDALF